MPRDKIARALQKNYQLDRNSTATLLVAMLKNAREFEFKTKVPEIAAETNAFQKGKPPFVFLDEMTLVSWFADIEINGVIRTVHYACLCIKDIYCDDEIHIFYFTKDDAIGWDVLPIMAIESPYGEPEYKILSFFYLSDDVLDDAMRCANDSPTEKLDDDHVPIYIKSQFAMRRHLAYIVDHMPDLKKSNKEGLEFVDWSDYGFKDDDDRNAPEEQE